jgi:hypothetical protein
MIIGSRIFDGRVLKEKINSFRSCIRQPGRHIPAGTLWQSVDRRIIKMGGTEVVCFEGTNRIHYPQNRLP